MLSISECLSVTRLAGIPSKASGSVWLTSTMFSLFSTPASILYLLLGGQEIQGRTCLVCQEVLLPSREKDIDLAGKTEICLVFRSYKNWRSLFCTDFGSKCSSKTLPKYVFGSVYTIKKIILGEQKISSCSRLAIL